MSRADHDIFREAWHRTRQRHIQAFFVVAICLFETTDIADAQSILPKGGSVVSGQASIGAPSSSALTVLQTSSTAIIDWNSFSVGPKATMNFVQPNSSSAVLNRVTGATSSTIAGQIGGNGEIFLVNPNGIAITKTGSVQVGGGFVASTLDISNANFNAGELMFAGSSPAALSNAGKITAAANGFVGLVGGTIANAGTIVVPLGKVGIGSGQQVTLDPSGDGFLQVALPTKATTADGRALIDVTGEIKANGGTISIRTATAQQAVHDAINISGSLSARSVSGRNGAIMLDGGDGGAVTVSGRVLATGGRHTKGGTISMTGHAITLRGALVETSGGSGGGSIVVGRNLQVTNPSETVATINVDANTTLRSDATVRGNGGSVTVFADGDTAFAGHLSARGGVLGGNGGQAEVSGKAQLTLSGPYSKTPLADLTAPKGIDGTILFDPGTVDIVNQSSLTGNAALNGPDTFTAQFISGQLATANVTIDTNNATGANGAAGNINLLANAQIAWAGNSALTLNAAGSINFAPGASIGASGVGAALTLRADTAGAGVGTVSFAGANQVNLPNGNVTLYYNPESNRTAADGGTNAAAGTVNLTSYTAIAPAENWTRFISAGSFTPWMLVNSIADLQNVDNNLAANYALGANINAISTSTWNSDAGFTPIGTDGAGTIIGRGFSGNFDGLGHVVSNLYIDRGGANDVGLFGYVSGNISNLGLTNANISGSSYAGALAGVNAGRINGSYVTGSVSGISNVGGLVGWNQSGANVSNSYATDATHASGIVAGGLVGLNDGNIATSYATGLTSAFLISGGLVGSMSGTGTISQSYFDSVSTGQLLGVGAGSLSGAVSLLTSVLQNGVLPSGFDLTVWVAIIGDYPLLGWQAAAAAPSALTPVIITATDTSSGSPTYGNPISFSYKVTDALGNVLCTTYCSAYVTGAPLIDTTVSASSPAGTSAPGYISRGTLVPQSGYTLQFINDLLNVSQRPLTITASNQSKSYGATGSLGTSAFITSGVVNGDDVTAVTLESPGGNANATVAGGPYAITASNARGTGLSNYTIRYVNGLLSITPAPISVTALGGSSVYGTTPTNPGLSATGLQNGQTVGVLTGLSNSFDINSTTAKGNYHLSVTGTLTNSNYRLVSTNSGLWSVTDLRGAVADGASPAGSSPSIAGQSINPPSNGGIAQALGALFGNGAENSKNASGSSNSASQGNPGQAAENRGNGPAGQTAPSTLPSHSSQTFPYPPSLGVIGSTRIKPDTPSQSRELSDPRYETCAVDGADASSGYASGGKTPPGTQAAGCAEQADRKPGHAQVPVFPAFDWSSVSHSIERAVSDVKNSTSIIAGATRTLAAGATIALTAGVVSWILRSGVWLSVLLSSAPLWNELDPLPIVLRRRKAHGHDHPLTQVDKMFERPAPSVSAEALPKGTRV